MSAQEKSASEAARDEQSDKQVTNEENGNDQTHHDQNDKAVEPQNAETSGGPSEKGGERPADDQSEPNEKPDHERRHEPNENASAPAVPPKPKEPAAGHTAPRPRHHVNVTMPAPFSFNRFLEQMKHRSAVPVNEYVKSKRQYRPQDQVKLIFDFIDFISERMSEAAIWAQLSPEEFDLATEGMEKLIMNRVYTLTYSPAIAQDGRWTVQTDDLERDRVLKQRIALFSWVKEEHLDIVRGTHSDRFYAYACDELCKMNQYKAPRDKIICILNCCKVVFGLIRHLGQEENADAFVPLLILIVLRANPPHLVSNIEYIMRFKNPNRATSEADYYLSTLVGAATFIENMDHTSLSHIDQDEYEACVVADRKMEEAVSQYGPSDHTSPETSTDRPLPTQIASISLEDTRAFFQRTGEAARQNISAPVGAFGKLLYERIDNALAPPSHELMEPSPEMRAQASHQAAAPGKLERVPPVSRHPITPAPGTLAATPGPGVAPNAPRRVSAADTSATDNASVSVTSTTSADLSPGVGTPPARRAPQWRGGLMPRFLADNDDDDERDSPSHHVAAARLADTSATEDESVDTSTIEVGTETLRSIFPQAEESVLVLVLQESRGNVELAIDRLLDMT